MAKKVLILGVASVQMDAVAVLKEMGCETYTCAMAKDGPAAEISDHFEIINILDVEKIVSYIQENAIDAVYSTGSDLAMPIACAISERLGLPHFVSAEAAYTCNHKDAMRAALTQECKGNIPHRVLEEIEHLDLPYPLILKPSDSQGQRGIFLVHSQEEFEAHFEEAKSFSRDKKVIVEKYVDGPELSVNTYLVDGEIRFLVASDRDTWPEYTGLIHKHIVPAQALSAVGYERLKDVVTDACRRVGIKNGPAYFQIKVEAGDYPYIIEMTPRLDGCHMWKILSMATGINLMKLAFEHLLNGDTSELDKEIGEVKPMELVFWCQKPHTTMDRSTLELPEDALHHFYYYNTGDTIRPVNGRYDKIGYYIRKLG
ncbi:MAG: ATP-grasp domain-containing protein [Ruminococcaceae bacterium]|nr:ATP-grasp domain-containing protein [Oscillospiraceae bacterium]